MARDRTKESQFCSSRPSGSQQFRRVEMVWSRADKGQRKRSSSYGTAVRAIPLLPSSSRSTISCQKANANENENAYVVRDFELGRAIRVRKGRKKKRRRKGEGGEGRKRKGRRNGSGRRQCFGASISRIALAADFHGRPTVWRKNVRVIRKEGGRYLPAE